MNSKQQLQAKQNNITKTTQGDVIGSEQVIAYSGTIPHPDILKGLADIDKTFPNRIITIAENHAKTEDDTQKSIVKINCISLILGQVFSFLFGLLGLIACIILSINKMPIGALISGIVVIVQVVITGVTRYTNK